MWKTQNTVYEAVARVGVSFLRTPKTFAANDADFRKLIRKKSAQISEIRGKKQETSKILTDTPVALPISSSATAGTTLVALRYDRRDHRKNPIG